MAEEPIDPRVVPWHPRRRHTLYGHHDAEARLLHSVTSGKLHHAWLLTGPRGIGKATLAYRLARYLVLPPSERPFGTLAVPASSPVSHQVAAGAHPGLFVLERGFDPKTKKLKSETAIADARDVIGFLNRTSSTGGWRVVIVDPADDLNLSSANALLKMIEEPPPRSIFLLVAHQPGRMLRTIRSRSIRLSLARLDTATTLKVLRELPAEAMGANHDGIEESAELAQGSPGRALELHGSLGATVFAGLQRHKRLSPAICLDTAAQFGQRISPEDYNVFCDLLVKWIGTQARAAALKGGGRALADGADDIVSSLRQADALNLDRRQTVTDALLRLDEALKAS